jgi:2-isopropylmalate synthase
LLESEYGLELPRRLQIEFSQAVQAVMDNAGKELTAQDLWRLFEEEYGLASIAAPQVQQAVSVSGVALTAQVRMAGATQQITGQGAGPIEAFVNGLNAALGTAVRVLDYHEHALGSGADARAVAYLELRIDERHTVFGVGMDANIVSASLKAILSGWQRAQMRGSCGENTPRAALASPN